MPQSQVTEGGRESESKRQNSKSGPAKGLMAAGNQQNKVRNNTVGSFKVKVN